MEKDNKLQIDTDMLKAGAQVLRAIKHKLRMQIIQLIQKKESMNVTDIYKALKLEQSVASQHLAILRKEGFVITERHGKEIFYSVNYKRFHAVDKIVRQLLHSE